MDELIKALNNLYADESVAVNHDDNGLDYFDVNTSEVAEFVAGLCCGELITSYGGCNWAAIKKLEAAGYDVYAGEKDSFGWLTGCVQKAGSDRVLVYG